MSCLFFSSFSVKHLDRRLKRSWHLLRLLTRNDRCACYIWRLKEMLSSLRILSLLHMLWPYVTNSCWSKNSTLFYFYLLEFGFPTRYLIRFSSEHLCMEGFDESTTHDVKMYREGWAVCPHSGCKPHNCHILNKPRTRLRQCHLECLMTHFYFCMYISLYRRMSLLVL